LLAREESDKAESWETSFSEKRGGKRVKTHGSPEIAHVLVRFDHVASRIVNANRGIM